MCIEPEKLSQLVPQDVYFVLLFFWLNFLQAQVSVHRLEEFLKLEEIQPDNVIRNMPSHRKFQ